MINGRVFATKDQAYAMQCLNQGFKVIYVGDVQSITPQERDAYVVASYLVPDYAALSAHIDGNEQEFVRLYYLGLSSKPAMEMFAAIIACLYKGYNVVFYIPQSEETLDFIEYLLKFIEFNFGIMTQTRTTPFAFNQEFIDKDIELLYLTNLVTYQEFLQITHNLDDVTIDKLIQEVNPPEELRNDREKLVKWFSNLKDSLCGNLVKGMMYV